MNARVRAVVRKELRDYRRNKLVVLTMALLPIVLVFFTVAAVLGLKAGTSPQAIRATVGGVSLEFFLIPLILPTVVAAYGVVGEREQGTLEPVLTTPVRREELLIGKALAAVVPSVLIAYGWFVVYAVLVRLVAIPGVVRLVWQPAQVLAIVLFIPLLATFSVWTGLAISARSSDVRVAQQLAALVVLPMVGVLALFTFRVIEPTVTVGVTGALLLVALDMGAWRIVSGLFDRERLLTRYGPA